MSRRDTRTPEQREHDELRRHVAIRDERRSQIMSRGEILDAIDHVIVSGYSNHGDAVHVPTLQALREAFE